MNIRSGGESITVILYIQMLQLLENFNKVPRQIRKNTEKPPIIGG